MHSLAAVLLLLTQSSYDAPRAPEAGRSVLAEDHPAWGRAAAVRWGPARYETRFRALWNADGLHLRFDAADEAPWHTMTRRDDPLWEEEVVEIFLDPDRSGRYVEVEVNPVNVVCDLRWLGPGETAADPIGAMDRGFDVRGMETSVASRADGWTALLFLPWTGLGLAGAPEPGSEIPFNVFRIKRPGGPEAPGAGAVFAAWSETGGPSFHVPEAFRPLRLAP